MKREHLLKVLAIVLMSAMLAACENANWNEESEKPKQKDAVHVVFNVKQFELLPFDNGVQLSRASVNIDQVCTRINLAVFRNGEKVKAVSQKAGDDHFGTVGVDLEKGTYKVVIIAHSGKGSATITSPEKITFPDNKVTDTFSYCGDVTVGDEQTYDIELKRVVAMFRLVTEDAVPARVTMMRFYYTGGSSSLNAVTGQGCVKSRQTELRPVLESGKPGTFEVYTFPRDATGELKMTATALDASSNIVKEQVFSKVPMRCNMITQYTGTFFGGLTPGPGPSSSPSFVLKSDNAWTQNDYRY